MRHRRKSKTRQIEQKTKDKQSDWKMHEHRMNRMPERVAFEKIFKHVDLVRRVLCAAGFGDLAPFLLRHARDANAVFVNHHSAQISRSNEQKRADRGKQQWRALNFRG